LVSPAAGDIFLLGEPSALELAGCPSLSSVAALSVDAPLLHSSKEGIRGGRLGGAGAALFGPFWRGRSEGLLVHQFLALLVLSLAYVSAETD